MGAKMRFGVLGILLLCRMALVPVSSFADAPVQNNVLYLSSASYSFPRVMEQIAGIKSVLSKKNVAVEYMFMEMEKYASRQYLELFTQLLAYKIAHAAAFDVVFLGGDYALNYALEHLDLFPGVPLVFLGVHDTAAARAAASRPFITGVADQFSCKETIQLAARLFPGATSVAAITDDTPVGRSAWEVFKQNEANFPGLKFREINTSRYSYTGLCQEISHIGRDTLLFFLIFSEDNSGRHYSFSDGANLIRQYAAVPVFRFFKEGVGKGFFGGKVLSYYKSGVLAAKIAEQILGGMKPSEIAMVEGYPGLYYFDYKELGRFGLEKSSFPPGTVFINHRKSWSERYAPFWVPLALACGIIFFAFYVTLRDNRRKSRIAHKLRLSAAELHYRVRHDALTGLYTRSVFTSNVVKEIVAGNPCAVVIIDVDDFKSINDNMGHSVGDTALRVVADRLMDGQKSNITGCRYGGDEFTLLITEAGETEIRECLELIRKNFVNPFQMTNGQEHNVTVSMGVARFPEDAVNYPALLSAADAALYRAKNSGKNVYIFFHSLSGQEKEKALSCS